MMPVPMFVGQFEQARQYFLSCPHLDHHVAMDRASAETLKIFAPQLGPRAWAGLSAFDKLSLMREVVLEWRRQAGIFFETFRQMAPVDECFRTNEGRATTWTEVKLQLEKGTQKMFDASSADRVHADLYARTGGCLCWGTWALALAPSAYEQWSREIFPVLRPFGADVLLSELVVKITTRVFRVKETLTRAEIKTIFKDYTLWGHLTVECQSNRRCTIFIMKPFTHEGCEIPGLVWVNSSSCSKILSVADDLAAAGFHHDVPERLRTTYSDVPIKLRATLEKSGCAVEMSQVVRLCGESAVVEHLRRVCRRLNRPDVHGDLFIRRDGSGNVTNAVAGKIVWSESGRNETAGHWGVAFQHPMNRDEMCILSTNIHMAIAPEMRLLGEPVLKISHSSSHMAQVMLGYIERTNVAVHGDSNVFIGSRWSHVEREHLLPRYAQNAIAVVELVREQYPLLADVKSREIDTMEYYTQNPRRGEAWLERAREYIATVKNKMRTDTRWSIHDLTLEGTRKRMFEADQGTWARAERYAATGEPELGLNFGCYLVFFADAFALRGVEDRAVIAAVEAGVDLAANPTFDVNDDEFSDLEEEEEVDEEPAGDRSDEDADEDAEDDDDDEPSSESYGY